MKKLAYLLLFLPFLGCFGESDKVRKFKELNGSLKKSSEKLKRENEKLADEILRMIEEDTLQDSTTLDPRSH